MAVYFITGKLGSGKTLQAVGLMKRYLQQGRPVASNIDLNLKFLLGRNASKLKAYRVPDRPTSADLLALGRGNPSKDESNNGALVLDECGIWFNSRNWNASGRQDIINFMLMVRKLGWDVYFLVQNISVIDKQARDTLAEYVAYCTSMSKVKIPVISALYRFLFSSPLVLPKAHHAVVRYGTSYNGLKADSWFYRGTELYSSYNTQQIFFSENSDNPADSQAVFCYVPPSYYCKPPVLNRKNIMRLTRIYLKKYNRLYLVLGAAVVGILAQSFLDITDPKRFRTLNPMKPDYSIKDEYSGYYITSYSSIPDKPERYTFSNGEIERTSDQLIKEGVRVHSVDSCSAQFSKNDQKILIKCKG